jgi:hypothetical protein
MHISNLAQRLLLVFVPLSLIWAQSPSTPQGSGTQRDPYLIATLDNLAWLSATPSAWKGSFRQTVDIDAGPTKAWDNGAGFLPIANYDKPFTGQYDGNGKTISGLFINRDSDAPAGLFGFCKGPSSLILNLSVINADIRERVAGILLGNCDSTRVVFCRVSGNVAVTRAGGGLAGAARFITASYSSSRGSVTASAGHSTIGGFAGNMDGSADNCFSADSVWSAGDSSTAGGFTGCCGHNFRLKLRNCYSSGTVRLEGSSPFTGGLVGGAIFVDGVNCFWDTQTSGLSSSLAGKGLTTVEMQARASFTDWDFNYTWSISAGNYPALRDIMEWWPPGTGARNDPFRISSLGNLFWVTQHAETWDKCFL